MCAKPQPLPASATVSGVGSWLYYSGFDNAGWVAADDIGSLGAPPWKDGPLTVHKGSRVAAMVAPPISLSILEAGGALDNKLLPLKTGDISVITTSSRFGIGLYTDTPGSPTYEAQLDAALDLVGEWGWVTIFLRKLNVRPHTPLEQRLSFVTDTPPPRFVTGGGAHRESMGSEGPRRRRQSHLLHRARDGVPTAGL
jgi:hypothetical protein